jgi:YD repeat-containing protein
VRYDILGNAVEQTANCCRKKTFTYTAGYHYAYPERETRGEGELQLSTSAVYDFNTGLVRISRDENEQETTLFYDVETHRPVTVLRPDGGRTDFHYHDALLLGPGDLPRYSRETTVTTFETGRTSESRRYFDGRGTFVRALGSFTAAQGWVTVDVEYDRVGRAFRASNPYYGTGEKNAINPSNLWTTNTEYDNFGRATEVTLPDGGKVLKNYAGTVITTTDPAGRQRRIVWDALGRAAELHEPDEDGNLGPVASPAQKTAYEYDVLSNLTKVTQAGSFRGGPPVTQVRQFRYDSLSRLTHQRQVEETARLDDDGAVSDAGHWTTVLKYDTWGNITDAYDALGAHSSIEYDTLNRPKSVTYLGETGGATPRVTYTYDQARTDASGEPYFNKGELTSVATDGTAAAPATRHDYDYGRAGQIVAQRQTVGAQTYALAYEYNLAGQLKKQTYPSGRVVAHTYDDAARLVSAAGGAQTYASSVSYAAHGGALGVVLGNGTSEAAEYNSRLQPTSLMLKVGSGAATKVIQQYAYKYGRVDQATGDVDETKNAGQVARVDGFIGGSPSAPVKQWEQRLTYDSIGRLAAAAEKYGQGMSQQSWRNRYSYDRWGNRYQEEAEQAQPLPYTAVEVGDVDRSTNRLAAPTQTSVGVEYDYAGQIIRDTKFRALNYDYDAKGRQVSSSRVDGTNEVRSAGASPARRPRRGGVASVCCA